MAADGESTDTIWMRLDIARSEVEEIYRLAEFEAAMREHGDDLWEAWTLTRSEARQRQSILQKITDRSQDYFERLDKIAMSEETKADTAARILEKFLESAKQLGADTVTERVELSPATVKLINRGDDILTRHRVKLGITPHGSDDDASDHEP
jgi:hypothetical protein